jgi:hypothetical protein
MKCKVGPTGGSHRGECVKRQYHDDNCGTKDDDWLQSEYIMILLGNPGKNLFY